jgi:hypothetical protein
MTVRSVRSTSWRANSTAVVPLVTAIVCPSWTRRAAATATRCFSAIARAAALAEIPVVRSANVAPP